MILAWVAALILFILYTAAMFVLAHWQVIAAVLLFAAVVGALFLFCAIKFIFIKLVFRTSQHIHSLGLIA